MPYEEAIMNQSRAIIEQRHQDLLAMIRRNRRITVSEASELLNVSPLTIRRDFSFLEQQHLIVRFHGGAYLNESYSDTAMVIDERKDLNKDLKELIGTYAVSMIPDHSTIFMNAGTTTLTFFRLLSESGKHVRVITNNALAPSVVWNDSIELLLTGGECSPRSKALVGSYAADTIEQTWADHCVLGATGISAIGTTTSSYIETQVNELMADRCNGPVTVIADGSKVGKVYTFSSLPLNRIHTLITDSTADEEVLGVIRDSGVQVIVLQGESE